MKAITVSQPFASLPGADSGAGQAGVVGLGRTGGRIVIVAIDGTNWIHALWHTVGDRAPRLAAERLSAVCDFAANHATVSNQMGPFHVVTCWDNEFSFRREISADYKAGRPEREPGLIESLKAGPDAMSKDGIPLSVDYFEADDLMASLAAVAVASGQQCILCSADKDLYQCLRAEKVTLLRKFKTDRVKVDQTEYVRMYEPEWMTTGTLITDTGLRPRQWVDYQCLVGEAGDNVKGCPGWGPVHAQAALCECGSVDRMLALLARGTAEYNPWKVPGGSEKKPPVRHRNLLAWRDRYPATRRLIELRTEVAEVADALR